MIRPALPPAFELYPGKDGTTDLIIRGFSSQGAAKCFLEAMVKAAVLCVGKPAPPVLPPSLMRH